MGVDTGVTGEQRELLDVSKRFMETACPLTTVRDGTWRDAGFAASYRRQAAELGWYSMLVPEALGGGSISGNGVLDAALIAYERGGLLQPGPFVGTNVVAYTIGAAGSEELREKVLPSLISGEVSASWAAHATGEGARADAGVQASSSSGGGLELNGAKNVVADAMGSAWLLVPAAGADGAVQALVPADAPGVTATELESLDLSRRFADVRFEGVQVPAANVIAADADLATTQLAIACALLVAETVGAMDHDFD